MKSKVNNPDLDIRMSEDGKAIMMFRKGKQHRFTAQEAHTAALLLMDFAFNLAKKEAEDQRDQEINTIWREANESSENI